MVSTYKNNIRWMYVTLIESQLKKVTHYFYASWSSAKLRFDACVILKSKMSAFCHLLLNLFNSVGQKKKKNGNFSKETKSHDARDILRVSQSVSCNIIYIIIQSKPIFFDFCLNLSVIDSMKHQQGQTNSACEICQKPWKIQALA